MRKSGRPRTAADSSHGPITDYLTGRDLTNGTESRTITRGTGPRSSRRSPGRRCRPSPRRPRCGSATSSPASGCSPTPSPACRRRCTGASRWVPRPGRRRSASRRTAPPPHPARPRRTCSRSYGPPAHLRRRLPGEVPLRGLDRPARAARSRRAMTVERQGARVIYKLSRPEGLSEHAAETSSTSRRSRRDGVTGMSTVRQASGALQLTEGLTSYITSWLGNDARPGGVLAVGSEAPPSRGAWPAEGADERRFRLGPQAERPRLGRDHVRRTRLPARRSEPPRSGVPRAARIRAREVCRVFGSPLG